MKREQAIALLQRPREQAITAILELAAKAEQWERLQNKGENTPDSPTTPSGLRDAVRLSEREEKLCAKRYERRKAKLHRRLDELIATPWTDRHAKRLVKRLRRHRQELLTLLDYPHVSPYNNHAEQQMRVSGSIPSSRITKASHSAVPSI